MMDVKYPPWRDQLAGSVEAIAAACVAINNSIHVDSELNQDEGFVMASIECVIEDFDKRAIQRVMPDSILVGDCLYDDEEDALLEKLRDLLLRAGGGIYTSGGWNLDMYMGSAEWVEICRVARSLSTLLSR
jgi:hypothetical protein